MLASRLTEELALLRSNYSAVDYLEANSLHWFQVQDFRMPDACSPNIVPVVFSVTQGYPGGEPYGFFVPRNMTVGGSAPGEAGPPHPPPFSGDWRFLSWSPVGWKPTADIQSGSNLWGWVRSFVQRLREGR
jgi:hypothetical protein